jgi:hypothetical protein
MYGCDSTVILNLNISNQLLTQQLAAICQGQSYSFGTRNLTQSGVYSDTLQAAGGCDSISVLQLTVNPRVNQNMTKYICQGDSFVFQGISLFTSGVYIDTLSNYLGCDSIVELSLIVNQPSSSTLQARICKGSSYNFGTQNLTQAGVYTRTLTNANGCDSVITLTLSVDTATGSTMSANICRGQSYAFASQNLSNSGVYYDTLSNANGCDSIIALTLQVIDPVYDTVSIQKCIGQSYTFHGQSITTSGVLNDTLLSSKGCDSLVTIQLQFTNQIVQPISASICPGATYAFHGQNLSVAGTYYDTLQAQGGCDSIVILTLNQVLPTNAQITASICEGSSYTFFNQTLTSAGQFIDTIQNVAGCDSIITLNLSIIPIHRDTINAIICYGSAYTFAGKTITQGGFYTDTLHSLQGCDSLISLSLNVRNLVSDTIRASICNGSTYNFHGTIVSNAGFYTDTLTNVFGCDSIVNLDLQILSPDTTRINASICKGSSYAFHGLQLTNAGLYYDTLTNQKGCDSLLILQLNINPITVDTLLAAICQGSSYLFGGKTYTQSGVYSDTLQSSSGCDSIRRLILTVNPLSQSSLQQSICFGSSYNFNGTTLTQAGNYSDTLVNALGCDSIIQLQLTVAPQIVTTLNDSICAGGVYTFHGNSLSLAGTYRDTLTAAGGCDSIVVLQLKVNSVPSKPVITRSQDTLFSSATSGNQWYFVGSGAIIGATAPVYVPTQANGGSYYVISTQNGCSSVSSDTIAFIGTSVTSHQIDELRVYPIPSNGIIYTQFDAGTRGEVIIQVYDLQGRILFNHPLGYVEGVQTHRLELSNIESGVYILQITKDGNSRTQRIELIR